MSENNLGEDKDIITKPSILSVAEYESRRLYAMNSASILRNALEYESTDQVLDYKLMVGICEKLLRDLKSIRKHIENGIGGPI